MTEIITGLEGTQPDRSFDIIKAIAERHNSICCASVPAVDTLGTTDPSGIIRLEGDDAAMIAKAAAAGLPFKPKTQRNPSASTDASHIAGVIKVEPDASSLLAIQLYIRGDALTLLQLRGVMEQLQQSRLNDVQCDEQGSFLVVSGYHDPQFKQNFEIALYNVRRDLKIPEPAAGHAK